MERSSNRLTDSTGAQMVRFLFDVNKDTLDALNLNKLKEAMGYSHPIIGVHLRRGDACFTPPREGHCFDHRTHLREAQQLAKRYGVNRIFIASDDVTSIRDAVKEFEPELEIVYVGRNGSGSSLASREFLEVPADAQSSRDGTEWLEERLRILDVPPRLVALSAIVDILLLAEADFFVGQFQSNLSRLAFALSFALKNRVVPYVSLDGAWCFHWRMCCQVRCDGFSEMCVDQ